MPEDSGDHADPGRPVLDGAVEAGPRGGDGDRVDGDEAEAAPERTSRVSRSTRSIIEWAAVVVGALVVALVVKTFLVQAFYIPSESMTPTLEVGDRVLVNKLDDDPSRGDVVVFSRPGGAGADGINDLIKRVIGLPGETLEGHDGAVYVDGERLVEDYLPDGTTTSNFGPLTVGADEIFVMGDNRGGSEDSRYFGPIPISSVVGRAFIVIWPVGDLGGL